MTKFVLGRAVPGRTLVRRGAYAIDNTGRQPVGADRVCRHLGAPLNRGFTTADGRLVCPWHGAVYNVRTGRALQGPQGVFSRVPGLGAMFRA